MSLAGQSRGSGDNHVGNSNLNSNNSNVRLQRDLVEVLTNPIVGFDVYLPNEGSNVNHWVIRYQVPDGIFAAHHFYFELRFPAQYPAVAPSVRCLTFMPHICVDSVRYDICLTMLSNVSNSRRYSSWAPCFSAIAVLMQMQAFFDDALFIFPQGPVPEEIAAITNRVAVFEKKERASMKLEHLQYHVMQYAIPLVVDDDESLLAAVAAVSTPADPASAVPPAEAADETWTVIESKRKPSTSAVVAPQTVLKPGPRAQNGRPLAPFKTALLTGGRTPSRTPAPLLKPVPVNGLISSAGAGTAPIASAGAGAGAGSVAGVANIIRPSGLVLAKNMYALPDDDEHSKKDVAPVAKKTAAALQPTPQRSSTQWVPTWKKLLSGAIPSNAVVHRDRSVVSVVDCAEINSACPPTTLKAASRFAVLSTYTLHYIFLYCSPGDIAQSMAACKFLRLSCIDGQLWKMMLSRYYPGCAMVPHDTQDHRVGLCWRQIWLMEANQARYSELKCFYSKKTIAEEVLGVPLNYTVNPTTGCVDYIYSSMELMSKGTFAAGVRKNMWGEAFNGFMPLFLTKEHFSRALPRIQESIQRLSLQDSRASHRGSLPTASASRPFTPKMVLDVLPRMMNTMVVLLADQGIEELDTCVHGYCQLHRLFIGLLRQYPVLKSEIATRLRRFISEPLRRTKEYQPNLGELIVLVSVCEEVGWIDVISVLMQETFARSVMWLCRDCPALAALATSSRVCRTASSTAGLTKEQLLAAFPDSLLDEILKFSHTRHNLYSFHCAFLRVVGCSPHGAALAPLERLHDRTFGIPPRHIKDRLVKLIEQVVRNEDSNNWNDFFESVCMANVTKEQLKCMWLSSIKKSVAQGYHRLNTDFSKIQSRGVSNILLRGKSYPRVVFCIDTSGSMCSEFPNPTTGRNISRLDYVKEELITIFSSKLTHRNQFTLVPFNSGASVWSRGLQQATEANLGSAINEVRRWVPSGGTDFTSALEAAFNVADVEEIYFLSDGEDWIDEYRLTELVRRLSRNGAIQCHTTSFFAPYNGKKLLKAIANAAGGTYVDFNG
jgi:ubiquitin-protein ligase/Mg-chelatase subunit ChlD